MPRQTKIFRVFVSSTFTDMKEERNLLQKHTFPRLERHCERHGAKFQAVDLRWGVNEESQRNQKTVEICLNEVERCQRISPKPNFIILLGDKYGWQPVPAKIPEADMESIFSIIGKNDETINKWYLKDTNAIPPEYVLRPRGDKYKEYDDWKSEERKIQKKLRAAVQKSDLPEKRTFKYFASATHLEIRDGFLAPSNTKENPQKHVFAYVRKTSNMPKDKSAEGFIDFVNDGNKKVIDTEAQDRLSALKSDLEIKLGKDKHYFEYPANWEDGQTKIKRPLRFAALVYCNLRSIIDEQLDSIINPDEITHEANLHEMFKNELVRQFHGRKVTCTVIDTYLSDANDNRVMALVGESGSGKSSVMAKVIDDCLKDHKQATTVYRFLGTSSNSSHIVSLLQSVCGEIARSFDITLVDIAGQENEKAIHDTNGITEIFKRCLDLATADKPVIVFLDALDQLSDSDYSKALNWLPEELPAHAKIVVSALPDLESKLSNTKIVYLPLLPANEAESVLKDWLQSINRTITKNQKKLILKNSKKGMLPLYLKLVFEQARNWHSFDKKNHISNDVPGIINDFFDQLWPAHSKEFVKHTVSYMLCGRYQGLTEEEILEILAFDDEYKKIFLKETHKEHREALQKTTKIPIAVWSRLYLDLEPYLTERDADGVPVITFFHRQFVEVLQERYSLTPNNLEKESLKFQVKITNYFSQQPHFFDMDTQKKPNIRKCSELVWQLLGSKQYSELNQLLTDSTFLEAKSQSGMIYDLVNELDDLTSLVSSNNYNYELLKLLEIAIRRDIDFIHRHHNDYPQALFQSLWNSCWWYDCPELANHYILSEKQNLSKLNRVGVHKYMEEWRSKKVKISGEFPWIKSNRPPEFHLSINRNQIYRLYENGANSICTSPNGEQLGSLHDDGTIKIWEISTGNVTSTIKNSTIYSVIKFSNDSKNLFYTPRGRGQDVSIWNLEKNCLIHTTECPEGRITNFDISSDESKLLTVHAEEKLNINRSKSAKIWDIDSGKELCQLENLENENFISYGVFACVRFSSDGQTVLCSDDRSIRFWNVQNGKLLKRIPNETGEYFGNFAIHPDGNHLIICTTGASSIVGDTRELNNVYVWNLIDFTLKAQWKAHAKGNVCLSISQDGKYLATGGADRTIKIWAWNTFKEVATFRGHIDRIRQVEFLKNGNYLVSNSFDSTIRIWDIKNNLEQKILRNHEDYFILNKSPRKSHFQRISCLVASSDNQFIATGSPDETVRVWDVKSGQQLYKFDGVKEDVTAIAFSPNNKFIAFGERKTLPSRVFIWNLVNGKLFREFESSDWYMEYLKFSPDGEYFLGCDGVSIGRLWDVNSGVYIKDLGYHKSTFRGLKTLQFISNSKQLLIANKNNVISFYDIRKDKINGEIKDIGEIADIVLSKDNSTIAVLSTNEGQVISIWDINSFKCINKFEENDFIVSMEFSSDSNKLLIGTKGKWDVYKIQLWNLETGEKCFENKTNVGNIQGARFTALDKQIMAQSHDNHIQMWDAQTGDCIYSSNHDMRMQIYIQSNSASIGRELHEIRFFNENHNVIAYYEDDLYTSRDNSRRLAEKSKLSSLFGGKIAAYTRHNHLEIIELMKG